MSYWDKIHKNLDKNLDDSHEIIKQDKELKSVASYSFQL